MSGQSTASEQVTSLMNDWYVHMRAQDTEKSNELQQQAAQQFEQIQQDVNLSILYSLMQFRYSVMERNFDNAASQLEQLTPLKNDMDHLLSYYYYFFKGIYAYGEKRYDEAIKNYQIAEKLLGSIDSDPIERAEFHYKFGQAYFYLDYLTLSIDHSHKALDIFESQQTYQKRCADCKITLGQSYTDLRQFDHALFYYEEANINIEELNDNQLYKNIINQNLGLLYSRKKQSENAIYHFKLSLDDNNRMEHQLAIIYVLAKECFKINKRIEGEHWLSKGLSLTEATNESVYIHRFKILQANYIKKEQFEETYTNAINYFQKEGLWDHVEEYSYSLGDYYYERHQYKMASMYYRAMIQASSQTSLKGGI